MLKQNIVIVGGGTAGWMAANMLQKKWGCHTKITLVESPDIGIIGVGEGSTPSLKRFFELLDIPEDSWMAKCNATYKVNIRFNGWSPKSGIKSYGHPFVSQTDMFVERAFYVNCLTRRLGLAVTTTPEKFFLNGWLANSGLAPLASDNFPFEMVYGYHFDSELLGDFLRQHAKNLGVVHISQEVKHVSLKTDGSIHSLTLNDQTVLNADLFVDCTGLKSLLMQKTLAVPFKSFSNNLFNDSAVVVATEALSHAPVETQATAATSGWIWQIPLQHRTGNGYVYSKNFCAPDTAETELRRYLGLLESNVECRHLRFNTGQVKKHWYKNCLALGLSQGFIEPLEATALHLVQGAIELFIEDFERGNFTQKFQDNYNSIITKRFESVRDYIVAHYKLNTIVDNSYWFANQENSNISDDLQCILMKWQQNEDLLSLLPTLQNESHFSIASWHCLFAGYGIFSPASNNQPSGQHDMFVLNKLDSFFSRCLLNFRKKKYTLQ